MSASHFNSRIEEMLQIWNPCLWDGFPALCSQWANGGVGAAEAVCLVHMCKTPLGAHILEPHHEVWHLYHFSECTVM